MKAILALCIRQAYIVLNFCLIHFLLKGVWRARMIAVKRLKYYYPTLASPASSMSLSSAAAAAAAVADHEQEFQKELHLMSKLRHPNVVEFVGAVATQGHLAIVCRLEYRAC